MATTADHIAARNDAELQARLVAAAEIAGVPNAAAWVESHRGALIAAPIEGGSTIADVYAYALASQPPPPGRNPAAVTDPQLEAAIVYVQANPA